MRPLTSRCEVQMQKYSTAVISSLVHVMAMVVLQHEHTGESVPLESITVRALAVISLKAIPAL